MGQNGASSPSEAGGTGQITPHSTTQPLPSLHPSSLDRPPKPRPKAWPWRLCCLPHHTSGLCVSTARCDLAAVLLLPIIECPWSTRAPRVLAPRSRTPLLRCTSLPRPLGLHCCRVHERVCNTHILINITRTDMFQHVRPRCCLAIIAMIVNVMTTSTRPGLGSQHATWEAAPGSQSSPHMHHRLSRSLRNGNE